MHVLVIPAWYNISDPISGIFFHEYCNALASKAKVTLLNIKFHSFSDRFRKKEAVDRTGTKKYELLQIDYYNPFPGTSPASLKEKMKKAISKKINEQIQKKGKWDVVHIQSVCNNISPWIAKMISEENNIPYVLTEHYTSFKEAGENNFKPFTSMEEIRTIVKNASKRFGVSDHACNYYKNIFGCEFETVYNIIPDELINIPSAESEPTNFTFTCIGNLQPRKGQAFIIEAFNSIYKELNNAKLVFVGEGIDKEKLVEMVRSLEIEDKVKFVNNIPKNDVIKIIDESKVIISASENETFGLTLAESLLRGRPVISTRSGGPEELVNESNGILISKGDVKAMAESMKAMYLNYDKYDRQVIRNSAVEKFSESAIVPVMINKYKEVLKN